MDLDTFLTTLYVLVDDWYKAEIAPSQERRAGAKARMSDSEVLTVAIAGQWRVGVPWQSERGLVRYLQTHGRGWFPTMLGRSAFNARVRRLWGLFIRLQQYLAAALRHRDDVYECVDSEPLPACSLAHASREAHHWLWLSRLGRGGTTSKWVYGDRLLVVVTPRGVITGWLVGTANLNDRWLLEGLLSARVGTPQLVGPAPNTHQARHDRPLPPCAYVRGFAASGAPSPVPLLADGNFTSRRWFAHWKATYGATVLTKPRLADAVQWSREAKRQFSRWRQMVDTVFARLDGVFGLKRLNAHSYWGQLTRLAASITAYTVGLWMNVLLDRPLGSLATLLC